MCCTFLYVRDDVNISREACATGVRVNQPTRSERRREAKIFGSVWIGDTRAHTQTYSLHKHTHTHSHTDTHTHRRADAFALALEKHV